MYICCLVWVRIPIVWFFPLILSNSDNWYCFLYYTDLQVFKVWALFKAQNKASASKVIPQTGETYDPGAFLSSSYAVNFILGKHSDA